jgi:protocatechuate 3,4-dioxygenase beta subunit
MRTIAPDGPLDTAAPEGLDQPLEDSARRRFLFGAASSVAAFFLLGSCGGSGGESSSTSSSSDSASSTCTLYPEETEGPYYQNVNRVRRDITEGKPGAPLTLVLHVQDESGCDPLTGIDVEIWHADAAGVYSDESSEGTAGEIYLRGTQTTDGSGIVEFETIYPGWYAGRTTHIHFKVHLSDGSVVTSQMYFPEAVTAAVYATAPYAARGPKDTSNAEDSVYATNTPPLLAMSTSGSGYVGNLTVTVDA